ncbi:MAG: Crp/Fnr family transcriptional regulator [Bacteroidia bacterium]|nr:Crp/Fnr family transcriptional regulator [Bacteroidia bacterium]
MHPLLTRYIEQFVVLGPEDWALLAARAQVRHFERDAVLHQRGTICEEIFFITQGVVRHYHRLDDKEGIAWFTMAGELATDIQSFLSRTPGIQSLIASTEVYGFSITHAQLQELYDQSRAWERFGRLSAEQYILMLAERANFMQFKSAREKYENLIKRKPDLLQQVSLGQIASYLGITLETLSRIRGK